MTVRPGEEGKCRHHVPNDWNCNACSDSGDDPTRKEGKHTPTPELMEKLAEIEHDRWSGWMRHQLKVWSNSRVQRWRKLAETPYSELDEETKEFDRVEVRKTWAVIMEHDCAEVEELKSLVLFQKKERKALEEKNRGLVEALNKITKSFWKQWVNPIEEIIKISKEALERNGEG